MKKDKKVEAITLLKKYYPDTDTALLRGYIASRNVKIGGETIVEAGQKVPADSELTLEIPKFVSRGGTKLEHALEDLAIDVRGLVCLDAGSSTGGFTDCLLQRGASLVHSVDVGYNQLDYRLRTDSRVVVHERTNILHLTETDPPADFAVADLSFRSVRGVASHILSLTAQRRMIFLIKPQFEIEADEETFNGVITDDTLLAETMDLVYTRLEEESIGIQALLLSPITGRKGNREFLALLSVEPGMDRDAYLRRLSSLISSGR